MAELVLPPWREQMSLCAGAVQPSHTVLLEEVAQGGFGGVGVAGTTPSSRLWPLRGLCHVWLW